MVPVKLLCIVLALICFALAALGVPSKIGLVPLGLLLWCIAAELL